ncbi:MAG: GNAT family N-acetyltransferase [Firmicutes bacterium]|nr:GNAT family N-acetyltransferase [Bacillota bacterium]
MSAGTEVTVRYAKQSDVDRIVPLLAELAGMYGVAPAIPLLKASVSRAIGWPERVRFVVAEDGGALLGIASLHLGHFSTFSNTEYAHVEDVYVLPEYRGRKVAWRMLEFMRGAAKEIGCSRLELHALETNAAARNLYERFGFKSIESIVYTLKL